MLYRSHGSLVQAIQMDGSERAYRSVFTVPAAHAVCRRDGVEVMTGAGPRVLHRGYWLTRDQSTGVLKVHDDASFSARHEPILVH